MKRQAIMRTLYIIPWLVAVLAIGWLLLQRFPPSGIITFHVPFNGSSAWMDPFLPAERTTSPGVQQGGWTGQRILQDPVYSAAKRPGVFEELELVVEFRPVRQPLVEIGILRDEATLSFEFEPVWFEPLESDDWRSASYGGRNGYVRDGASDGLLASSNYQRLISWHATATPITMCDQETEASQKTDVSLRGSHDIWALPAGNRLRFSFAFQDSNRKEGRDTVVIHVLHDERIIYTDAVGIGGSKDARMEDVVHKNVDLRDVHPGVYRIQVLAEDDVFIRSIATPTRRWVIGPRLSFGDLVGYRDGVQPGIAWSNSRHLVLTTFHAEGLQTVIFGDDSVKLTKTHEPFRLDRTDDDPLPKKLTAPLGDVRIVGDGWFAFRPESFFTPQPRRVTDSTDLDLESVDAVLTPYVRPEPLEDGWYRGIVRFDLDPSRDHARFAISAPGIETRAGAVDIRSVTLTYRRPPLNASEWWRIVKRELVNAWKRMRQ